MQLNSFLKPESIMSQASPTSDEGLRAIYHYAVRRMAAGASGATLQRELVEKVVVRTQRRLEEAAPSPPADPAG